MLEKRPRHNHRKPVFSRSSPHPRRSTPPPVRRHASAPCHGRRADEAPQSGNVWNRCLRGDVSMAAWFRGKLARISVNFAICTECPFQCDFGITRPCQRDCDFGPRLVHNAPCVELTGESLRPSKCVSSRGRAAGAFAAAGVARTSVSRCARIRVISDCMQTSIAVRLSSGRICKTIKGGSTVPTFSLRTPPL